MKIIEKHDAPKLKNFNEVTQENTHLCYPIELNPYNHIYVDLNHKCNMNCNVCYTPIRTLPDMDIKYFEEACSRLPRRVVFRFLGGEPTLHPDFFKFIEAAKKYKHMVSVASNGIKYADSAFVKKMSEYPSVMYGITMNGGMNDDRVYQIIDNAICAKEKSIGLQNMLTANIPQICLSAIIVRDLNEFVVKEFLDLGKSCHNIRYLKFRSIGKVGRFIETEPYSTKEFKEIVLSKFLSKEDIESNVTLDGLRFEPENNVICRQCCYHFNKPEDSLKISFVEFSSPQSEICHRRGKLLENTFKIEPLFEYISNHSDFLDTLR